MTRCGCRRCSARTGIRLLEGAVAEAFFDEVLREAGEQELLSEEHFTVDGTLLEAWASQKSSEEGRAGGAAAGIRAIPRWTSTKRSGPTKRTSHDRPGRSAGPEGQRQGGQAELRRARADGEPQRAAVVNVRLTQAPAPPSGEAAVEMVDDIPGPKQVTVGADKARAVAGTEGHAARGAEPGTAAQCHRQPTTQPDLQKTGRVGHRGLERRLDFPTVRKPSLKTSINRQDQGLARFTKKDPRH